MTVRTPNRCQCRTQRVPTPFGALYAHGDYDESGRLCAVSISTPGKLHDTTMHDALIALGEVITELLPKETS